MRTPVFAATLHRDRRPSDQRLCGKLFVPPARCSPPSPSLRNKGASERAVWKLSSLFPLSLRLGIRLLGESLSLSLSVTPRFLRCSMHSYLCMGLGCVTVWATLDNSLPLSLSPDTRVGVGKQLSRDLYATPCQGIFDQVIKRQGRGVATVRNRICIQPFEKRRALKEEGSGPLN